MKNKEKKLTVFKDVEIIDAGAKGKAVAKINEKVVFVNYAAPGDIVDLQITKNRKNFMQGKIIKFHKYSDKREKPLCEHFGLCGGCKWQHIKYEYQLFYKQKQIQDNLKRIGKFEMPKSMPIIPSKKTKYYRNKLEFSFSDRKWLTNYDKNVNLENKNMNGLGFHIPNIFDKIIDIKHCYLQKEPSNAIRLAIKKYAVDNKLTFYNAKKHTGFLRNLLIRNTSLGDIMVIMVFNYYDNAEIKKMLNFIYSTFPEITSLMYIINKKLNDSISDQKVELYKGNTYILEKMEDIEFKISALSFYQTNSEQAYQLYKVVRDFADLKGKEIVYDLYTGTGTIANFIAENTKKVIGIEYLNTAIKDAKENSKINKINNTLFFAGDISKVLNDDFVKDNGFPDIIITDPPRTGMHKNVITQILKIAPEKIIYVSCNSATQARDISMMTEKYSVKAIQPVDMFPHTHHVENVVLLKKDTNNYV